MATISENQFQYLSIQNKLMALISKFAFTHSSSTMDKQTLL